MPPYTKSQIQGFRAKEEALRLYLEGHQEFTSEQLASAYEERAENIATGAITAEFDSITYAALWRKYVDKLHNIQWIKSIRNYLFLGAAFIQFLGLIETGISDFLSSVLTLTGLIVFSMFYSPALLFHIIYWVAKKWKLNKYLSTLTEYNEFYAFIESSKLGVSPNNKSHDNVVKGNFNVPPQDD